MVADKLAMLLQGAGHYHLSVEGHDRHMCCQCLARAGSEPRCGAPCGVGSAWCGASRGPSSASSSAQAVYMRSLLSARMYQAALLSSSASEEFCRKSFNRSSTVRQAPWMQAIQDVQPRRRMLAGCKACGLPRSLGT